jgi:DNA-binding transcriptional LysR family regulator
MNESEMLSMTSLRDLMAFNAVARHLSFARAAGSLGCTPSVLSRRIAGLETRVGGPVFLRSTRRVTLTPLGESLLAHCARLEAEMADMNARLRGQHAEAAGVVRLQVPTTYGRRCVAPILPELMSRYPKLQLDVTFDDGYADLIASRTDIALRIGTPVDSGLIAAPLRPIRRFLVASPDYVAQAPALKRPEDLKQHRCLAFQALKSGDVWSFQRGRTRRSVRVDPVLRTNNADALLEAAIAGSGVAMLSDFIASEAIGNHELVELMTGWPVSQPQVQMLWVAGMEKLPRVRVTIDYLRERLGKVSNVGATAATRKVA